MTDEVTTDRPASIIPDTGACQDCGEADFKRRSRCFGCDLLLCWWCYTHEHKRSLEENLGCRGIWKVHETWEELREWVRLTGGSSGSES